MYVGVLTDVTNLLRSLTNNQREVYQFKFDELFPANSTQEEVSYMHLIDWLFISQLLLADNSATI